MVFPKFVVLQFGILLLAIFCCQNSYGQEGKVQELFQQASPAVPTASSIFDRPESWGYQMSQSPYDPYLGLRTTDFRAFTASEARYHRTRGMLVDRSRPQSRPMSQITNPTPTQKQMSAAWERFRTDAKSREQAAMQSMMKNMRGQAEKRLESQRKK